MRCLIFVSLVMALWAPVAHSAYPGQNGKLAIEHGPGYDIYSVDPNGTNLTRLTTNPEMDRVPSWSPDGRRIAFASFRDGRWGIYLMNADGSDQRLVVDSEAFNFTPTWSPDGTRLAYRAEDEIHVVNLDGTGDTNLTRNSAPDYDPAWSPDGSLIAFWSQRDGAPEVYVMNPDGSGQRNVTNSPSSFDHSPDWAPDGSRILFHRDGVLHTIRPDGTGLQAITEGLVPGFSPDGDQIVFARDPSGLWIANADGSNPRLVPNGGYNPDWQPIPNGPPDCSVVRATPTWLGAPNHKLLTVTLSGATDRDGNSIDLTITGVTQDERVLGPADAVSTTQPHRVQLRAERDPHGDGRVYRIAFKASDGRGGACTGFATASVRKGTQAIDSVPPSYDSFGS